MKFICPKCECINVTVRYIEKSDLDLEIREYLVCKCERCDYKWKEETADAGKATRKASGVGSQGHP